MKAVIIAVLWLSCVSSAMGVVYVSYESRQATQKLEVLRRESGRMQVASGQFLLEKSTWAHNIFHYTKDNSFLLPLYDKHVLHTHYFTIQ